MGASEARSRQHRHRARGAARLLPWLLVFGCATQRGPLLGNGSALTLIDPRGVPVAVDELTRDRAATVLIFWSGSCPCVRRYQRRVEALLERYPAERVRAVGVVSNAGETLADARRVAAERGVRLPLYGDPDGRLAQAVGARSTPTVVVLDQRGAVRFQGWIDNERAPGERGREPWLERALDALLAGHERFAARTPTYGCAITRSLFGNEAQRCCTVPP